MRLKSFFLLLVGGFTGLVVVAWLVVIQASYHQYASARQARNSLAALARSLKVAELLALERGDHALALKAQRLPAAEVLDRLSLRRTSTSKSIALTRKALTRVSYFGVEDDLREFDDVEEGLEHVRADATRQLALAPQDRDFGVLNGYESRMAHLIGNVIQISGRIDQAVARADPTIGQISSIARLSAWVREVASEKGIAIWDLLQSSDPDEAQSRKTIGHP
jgi:hypothetical protein